MGHRMLCTSCFRTAEPDTLLEGSDLAEMLGWCAFALPGWLYCAWRHAARLKVCAFCGGGELVREARAARRRRTPQAPPSHGPRILGASGRVHWPHALGSPRERLRQGGAGVALSSALLLTWTLGPLSLVGSRAAATLTLAVTLLCATWMLHQIARISRLRRALPGCQAWDARGRPIRIELL
ncbi:MAG: hypothetical protein JRH19_20650 [Deltaproteobacteria bacterium]|nr:hypothetical protein [Deltaproteobacteria bacterium]